MKNAKTLTGACLLVLAAACLVLGEDKKSAKDSLAGTWDCVAHLSGEDDIPFTMTLDQRGEVVTGSVATHEGDLEVKSGTYRSGTLELHLETPDAKYAVTGKLAGDQFKGQWSKDPDGIGGRLGREEIGPGQVLRPMNAATLILAKSLQRPVPAVRAYLRTRKSSG